MSGTESATGAQILDATQPISADQLRLIGDPAALLDLAQELEPWNRFVERSAALDRVEELLDFDSASIPCPPGRDWRLELEAERVIDVARSFDIDGARSLAAGVLDRADPELEQAIARTQLGLGQALAWAGTDESLHESERIFSEAAQRFAKLGRRDWQGSALGRCGYSTRFQAGDLRGGEEMIRQALELWGPDSQRRSGMLDCYADVLTDLGELDRAAEILDEAEIHARRKGDQRALGAVRWGRARITAARGDAAATERILYEAEVEAAGTDWFEHSMAGGAMLLDAALLLDQLGVTRQARIYLERSHRWAANGDPDNDDSIRTVRATMLARSGDPARALEALQELYRREWLQKRLVWHHTLMTAWATLRLGDRSQAATLAARSFDQAVTAGSIQVALTTEPDLTRALAPLADEAGSAHGRALVLGTQAVAVRLFGTPTITGPDGAEIQVPAGKPSELVRMLAVSPHGLAVEVVLESFFPETAPSTSRHRLRQVLTRLRGAAGDIVVRDGEIIRLGPAWVDVREFQALAQRAKAARGTRALVLSHAALALADRGPLLVADPYADWAEEARDAVESDLERLRSAVGS